MATMRLALLLAPLALAGCVAQEVYVPPDLEQSSVVSFDIPQYTPTKVDLLFVVDRSPAMELYGAGVRAALRDAIAGSTRFRDQDFHVGVVSADLADGGRLAAYLTTRRLISGEDSANFAGELADVLPALVDRGHDGSAVTHAFDAARLALDHNPYNARFRRDDAALLVIIIAGQDDHSDASPEETAAYLQSLAVGAVAVSVIRGDGALRIDRLAALFPNRSTSARIDQHDLGTCFQFLPTSSGWGVGDRCIEAAIDGANCQFSDLLIRRWETVLPACGDELPCWDLDRSAQLCPVADHLLVHVRRAEYPPRGTNVIGQCVTR
ncbi:hypothetical protein BH11MYX3_BH11MYX3_06870 [soil metagenome]